MSLKMTYLYVSKHVALLDTLNLLSKCSFIALLHIICMYVRMCVCIYIYTVYIYIYIYIFGFFVGTKTALPIYPCPSVFADVKTDH